MQQVNEKSGQNVLAADIGEFRKSSMNYHVYECSEVLLGKIYVPKECFNGNPPKRINVYIEEEK